MFFPPRYAIRALKSAAYMLTILAIVMLMFYLSSRGRDVSLSDLTRQPTQLVIFFTLIGIVYPLVSFVRKSVMLRKSLAGERIDLSDVFNAAGYELSSERNGVLTFRLKNRFTRIIRLFGEDMIDVEYGDGCIILSGLRRDVYRIAKYIEYRLNQ